MSHILLATTSCATHGMTRMSSRPTIKLPVRSLAALLDTSGSPVVADHIHPEAAKWIYGLASEHNPRCGFRVMISAPGDDIPPQKIAEAVRGHFAAEAMQIDRELKYETRGGLKMLTVALLIVGGLMLVSEALSSLGGVHHHLLGQSLIIISWVTLWRPAERLLYEPILLRRRRRVLEGLAHAEIDVIHPPEA